MEFPVRRIEKPWGYELLVAQTPRYVGKILHIEPHQALSLQYHQKKDETFYVASGEIELHIEQGGQLVRRPLRRGESYHVVPPTRHRMVAGADGCELFEVSTPELDDVVRLEDRYGRT